MLIHFDQSHTVSQAGEVIVVNVNGVVKWLVAIGVVVGGVV